MMNQPSTCTGCARQCAGKHNWEKSPLLQQQSSLSDELRDICGVHYVITDAQEKQPYERDETRDMIFPFDILVKPGTAEEVAAVLKVCRQHNVPVVPRGGGTGLTGGALAFSGGVVLSVERLNRILTVNTTDRYVIAEAGVITQQLSEEVQRHGLYFPILPTSGASSMLGGNVAENAGSINSCRYGSTADYVLNLQVALTSGELIWTGANVRKNTSGLNLTRLFAGSEGTLGVITRVVYRLLTPPAHSVTMLAGFPSQEAACEAVIAIGQSGIMPAGVELVCSNALAYTAAYLQTNAPLVQPGVQAQLLIELEASGEAAIADSMECLGTLIARFTESNLLVGISAAEKEQLRRLRYNIGAALRAKDPDYRDVDISLPLSALQSYLSKVDEVCHACDVRCICFGHALDGNLHVMLIPAPASRDADGEKFRMAVKTIYESGIACGGVISGEHGIGLLQKEFMPLQYPQVNLSLMKGIKQLMDPDGILNPGKIFH